MIALAEVLRRHWPAYEGKFGARLLPSHRRALAAIVCCRTPALGGQLFRCDCGRLHYAYHSCNHRAWLSAAATNKWERILALFDWKQPALTPPTPLPPPLCPSCHQPMKLVGSLSRAPPF